MLTMDARDVRVVDAELNDVPTDGKTHGEIVMRGNNVMKGYYNDPEATAKAFAGGWFHSGDVAVMHADGYIEIVDRAKDVIISGGENISTIQVEKVIVAHEAVLECAVVAIPDSKWGEVPKAFVTLKEGQTFDRRAARLLPRTAAGIQGSESDRVRSTAQDVNRQDSEIRPARQRVEGPREAR